MAYKLHLISLQCLEAQEVDGDEIYLTLNEAKIWEAAPDVMSHIPNNDRKVIAYDFVRGQKNTREGWIPMAPYNPGSFNIKGLDGRTILKIWDADRLTSHDLLGQTPITAADAEGGNISVLFNQDGAQYRLTYKVETEGKGTMAYETILIETPALGVGVVRLNRPQALNALNGQITGEIFDSLEAFDRDDSIGCIILTGSDKAFAAGADIKQMVDTDAVTMMSGSDFTDWTRMMKVGKPIIAAVSGWALGGGCEMAMMCDMIVASETAKFGQPEVTLGIIPGAGGTQRLTRAVGKAVAMEVMLGNRQLTAQEAAVAGLVNRVYPVDSYFGEAIRLAEKIASMPRVAVRLIKDAVNKAEELSLSEGLDYEKRNFYLSFGTEDKREGMTAFIEKRPAQWKHR